MRGQSLHIQLSSQRAHPFPMLSPALISNKWCCRKFLVLLGFFILIIWPRSPLSYHAMVMLVLVQIWSVHIWHVLQTYFVGTKHNFWYTFPFEIVFSGKRNPGWWVPLSWKLLDVRGPGRRGGPWWYFQCMTLVRMFFFDMLILLSVVVF